jgi:signal transduction histidine kinase
VVYVAVTLVSVLLFHSMMMNALDHELQIFAASFGRAIDVSGSVPYFRDWARTVKTEPGKSLVTIQLYDVNERLLESYGPKGYERIMPDLSTVKFDGKTMRVRTTDLRKDQRVVGYMQLELSTERVEDATRQFGWTIILTAPFVLIGLALTAIVVSAQVARPFLDYMHMLRRFIADAGHELNTPLSIVQARMQSISAKMERQGQSTDELVPVEHSLERMGKIVNDLMLLTEVEGPLTARPARTEVDLNDMVSQAVNDYKAQFADKGIALDYDPSPARLQGYQDALSRLLTNLLDNALKYTETGGRVHVQLKAAEKNVVLVVEDTGIGIPADSLPKIFDRFYRVDKSRSRASGGIGLGLSIVKAIAEAHKGTVSVQSTVGHGTKFTVSLPAA